MRRAVREELRKGAHQIKIMRSGGVSSPSDPVHSMQFSDEEIRVAVQEAERHGTYVAAHCIPDQAVRRCVELGVRSIEHAVLISESTAAFVASRQAYVVPTLAIIMGLAEEGERLGYPAVSMQKLRAIHASALTGLDRMARAGVKLGFGTDLLGNAMWRIFALSCNRSRVLLRPVAGQAQRGSGQKVRASAHKTGNITGDQRIPRP